jgi:hypothetical protein
LCGGSASGIGMRGSGAHLVGKSPKREQAIERG